MSFDRLKKAFDGRASVFLVALHVTHVRKQWEKDIGIAHAEGADGIIVIRDYNTLATDDDALIAYDYARKHYRDWHIGLNLLGHRPDQAVLREANGVSSYWFDEAHINEESENGAKYFADVRRKSNNIHLPRSPLLIPSVAMKYKPQPKSLARVAQLLEPHADIIVTSGKKTDEPPTIEKMRELRKAVSCPIGIVSGIDADNVQSFLAEGVNCFIVWSSISQKERLEGEVVEVLDPPKVAALRKKIPKR